MGRPSDSHLEAILRSIPNASNRETARRFLADKRVNGRKIATLIANANHIRAWARFLGEKRFAKATANDMRDFLLQRETVGRWRPPNAKHDVTRNFRVSDQTIETRKKIIRTFQAFVHKRGKNDPLPKSVSWIEPRPRNGDEQMPVDANDLLTRQELEKLVTSAGHPQVQAALATLYDSGMRASEFCGLRVGSVIFDDYGAVLVIRKRAVGAKTGARRVRILGSVPYLRGWLNMHPKRDDREAPLWLPLHADRRSVNGIQTTTLANWLHGAVKAAGIKRRLWPHLFRHSRATELAKEGMREREMCYHFGWSQKSDMPARYVHLTGGDVDEGILRRAGKLKDATLPESILATRRCQTCGKENAATNIFCDAKTCGKPLTVAAAESAREDLVRSVIAQLGPLASAKARADDGATSGA